jgi:hypothetical protein
MLTIQTVVRHSFRPLTGSTSPPARAIAVRRGSSAGGPYLKRGAAVVRSITRVRRNSQAIVGDVLETKDKSDLGQFLSSPSSATGEGRIDG